MRFSSYQEWSVGIAISWCPCEAVKFSGARLLNDPRILTKLPACLIKTHFATPKPLPSRECSAATKTAPFHRCKTPNPNNNFGCNTQTRGSDFATGCSALTFSRGARLRRTSRQVNRPNDVRRLRNPQFSQPFVGRAGASPHQLGATSTLVMRKNLQRNRASCV